MNRRQMVQLEPFAETTSVTYRFGYRAIGTDHCLSAVDVPASMVEQAVLTRASLATKIGPNGTVTSHISIPHVGSDIPDIPTDVASLEALIQRAVDAENLHREEATVADLSTLLRRLEDSVRLVKAAISQMAASERHTLG